MTQKTFIVLGMHRSATSLVGMGLAKSNVHIGETLLAPTEHNPYGHWEDVDFVRANNEILRAAGGSWDNPPPEEAIIAVGKRNAHQIAKFIMKKSHGKELWGWKDPRTTLTIRCYLPYLENPHFIACFREPMEVAKSLQRREGGEIEKWLELAGIYNDRLLEFLGWWTGTKKEE